MKVTKGKTNRGFALHKFEDKYGHACSLQKSSLAFEDAIWFGVDDAEPKIMASQASSLGIETTETTGWIRWPIPEDVLLYTRMHLTRDMVEKLLPILHKFVDTGKI